MTINGGRHLDSIPRLEIYKYDKTTPSILLRDSLMNLTQSTLCFDWSLDERASATNTRHHINPIWAHEILFIRKPNLTGASIRKAKEISVPI